jgi:hypothetical protein
VSDDDAVSNKRKRYYFSSAFSILLMVFFFFQLIYTVTCFLYNFESIKFDFSTCSTFCPMLVQIFYVLLTKNFVLQQSCDFALMMEEDSSSSTSKRSYSPSQSESHSSKRSFFGPISNPLAFLTFVVDSGATRHLTYLAAEFFSKFTVHTEENGLIQSVQTASGTRINSVGEGRLGPLHNVLSMPQLTKNLFSVRSACKAGYQVLFHSNRCDIFGPDDVQILSSPIISAFLKPPREHLYELKLFPEPSDEAFLATFSSFYSDQSTSPSTDAAFIADTRPQNNYTLLHQRLPHPSERVIKHMSKSENWTGLPKFTTKDCNHHKEHHCTGCALGKLTMTHKAIATEATYAKRPGELFFADLWFSNVASGSKNTCCLLIIDAVSRKLWRYFMTNKSEVQFHMSNWITELRAQEGITFQKWSPLPRRTATLKTDPGGEFLSGQLNFFLAENGIRRELSPSKDHCDMVERAIRTVKEATTSYLQNAKYELSRAATVLKPNDKLLLI